MPDYCRERGKKDPDGLVSRVHPLDSVFVLGLEKSQVDFTTRGEAPVKPKEKRWEKNEK